MTCERCNELQAQLDEVRDLVRKTGLRNFGTTVEGVALLLRRLLEELHEAQEPKGELQVSVEDFPTMAVRFSENLARCRAEDAHLIHTCIMTEAMLSVLAAVGEHFHIDAPHMLADTATMLAQALTAQARGTLKETA